MSSNIQLLEKYAGFLSNRSKLINENIANVSTKDYRRKDINFRDMMDKEISSVLKTTDKKHFKIADTSIDFNNEVVRDNSVLEDGMGRNNVQIDEEMVKMAETSIKFKFASHEIGGYYKQLQKVIKGGRVG